MKSNQESSEKMAGPAPTRADRIRARHQQDVKPSRVPAPKEEPREEAEDRFFLPIKNSQENGNVFARPVTSMRQARLRSNGKWINTKPKGPSVSKRFTIPLNKQGAELQVSSVPFTRLGWRGASAFLLIFSLVMLIMFTQMKIKNIQFIGISDALATDISKTLKVEGKPAFILDPMTLRHTMDIAFPEISDVRISIGFPGVMKVQAKTRSPIYGWVVGDRVYLIDDQLMVYPAHAGESIEGMIVIQADQPPPPASVLQQSGDILQEIADYVWPDTDVPNSDESGFAIRSTYLVDEKIIVGLGNLLPFIPEGAVILYSTVHGFGWKASDGWDAWFGLDLSKMAIKVGIYNAIVLKLVSEKIDASLISVEFIHAPYYREE